MSSTPAERWDPRFADGSGWFAPIAPFAARFAGLGDWPSIDEMNARLADDAAVVFVAAAKVRRRRHPLRPIDLDSLYEVRIARRGEVPTRPGNWHDFLNALIWAAFPVAKRTLTARLRAEKEAQAVAGGWRLPGARTPLQDALALLDEGGVLEPESGGAVIFGHAVLEHLIAGRPARVSRVPLAASASRAALDRALAGCLAELRPSLPRGPAVDLRALRPAPCRP
jgi:hypothetical protein